MQRTYLPFLAVVAAAAAPTWAAGVFSSQPLEQERFAVLAQPVGNRDKKARGHCWSPFLALIYEKKTIPAHRGDVP